MSKLSLTTVLSVLLLAGLVAYLIRETGRLQKLAARPHVVVKQVPGPAPAAKVRTIIQTNEFSWVQLESEDYREYIQRLRRVGCPEETIRDIIIADIEKLMTPRMRETIPVTKDLQYWEPEEKELLDPLAFHETARQQLEIDFEKRDIIKELIGVDLVAERAKVQGQVDAFGKKLGFLDDDKRADIRKIIERFNRAEVALREKVWADGDYLTAEDEAQLRQLQKQRETEIAGKLSAEELRQYEVRLSPASYKVRDSFFGMNASEKEFLAVFDLQKKFDEKWAEAPADDARRQTAETEMQAQLRQQLGEKRYEEYERAQDPDFRQLSVAAVRNNVPREKATEAYAMKRIATEQRQKVLNDPNLSQEQKDEVLRAISAETQKALGEVLGEKAMGSFMRRSNASWLR